jgi:hypothetical protein
MRLSLRGWGATGELDRNDFCGGCSGLARFLKIERTDDTRRMHASDLNLEARNKFASIPFLHPPIIRLWSSFVFATGTCGDSTCRRPFRNIWSSHRPLRACEHARRLEDDDHQRDEGRDGHDIGDGLGELGHGSDPFLCVFRVARPRRHSHRARRGTGCRLTCQSSASSEERPRDRS